MQYLSLDLAKTRTGFALWHEGWPRPVSGSWVLGGGHSTDGRVYHTLHRQMDELFREHGFQDIFYEQAISPQKLHGRTNIRVIELAQGLAAHVLSFAYARHCTPHPVHIDRWRIEFLGADELARIMDAAKAKGRELGKRISARDDLKAATVARCRQLGMAPGSDDEAEAIGILDYALGIRHVTPPWRSQEVLRAPLEAA